MSSKEIREKIIEDIEKLPKNSLMELMKFVSLLKSNMRDSSNLDPAGDPLLKYIGSISHGSLAQDIDKDLYGEKD